MKNERQTLQDGVNHELPMITVERFIIICKGRLKTKTSIVSFRHDALLNFITTVIITTTFSVAATTTKRRPYW
jgi:hypothetical protein